MKSTYSTKEASEITGASRQIIRTYTGTYARRFSTEGSPDQPGQPRHFTRDDLRLIRFIYVMTKERGQNHKQVEERGELEEFDWDPPDADGAQTDPGTALVPVAQLQAAQALMLDAQRREQELQQRIDQRDQRLEECARRLGALRVSLPHTRPCNRRSAGHGGQD